MIEIVQANVFLTKETQFLCEVQDHVSTQEIFRMTNCIIEKIKKLVQTTKQRAIRQIMLVNCIMWKMKKLSKNYM